MSLGIVPSLLVAGWCVLRHLPGRAAAEPRDSAGNWAATVKLAGLQYLRPGVVLYEGLELADCETGQTLFSCRLLEVDWLPQGGRKGDCRPMLSMIASQPQVEAMAIDRIWHWLRRSLESGPGWPGVDVRLSAAEATLLDAERSQTLSNIDGLLESLPSGTHAQIHFRLVGADTPEPARIRVVRNRLTSPPTNGFELYTGDGELPCSVLAMGLGQLKPLGPRCRFRGYIWANETPDGWQGEVTGRLLRLRPWPAG